MIASGLTKTLWPGGWLPLFHNMGLIALVLQPIFLGATAVMMAPASFIKQPASWLRTISQYGIQASGGPNFCFEHSLWHIHARDLSGVDLTCWRVCFSGGEPARQDLIKRFLGRFRRYGLRESVFCPCYGMAETTLFVAGCRPYDRYRAIDVDADRLENRQVVIAGPATSRRQTLVGCELASGFDVAVVHPATRRRIGPEYVGEIWLRGGSLAAGYWGRPELSREIFGAVPHNEADRRWLRTGDLGFIERNELFICGRLKDMIIVGGRCLDPDDIERRIPALSPLLKDSSVIAFGIGMDNARSIAIICEVPVKVSNAATCKALVRLIRGTIAAEIGVPVSRVVFAAKGSISHSTNGRPLRQETQHRLIGGRLDTIWNEQLQTPDASPEINVPTFHGLLRKRILRGNTVVV